VTCLGSNNISLPGASWYWLSSWTANKHWLNYWSPERG